MIGIVNTILDYYSKVFYNKRNAVVWFFSREESENEACVE